MSVAPLCLLSDYALFVIGADFTRTPENPDRPAFLTASLNTHFVNVAKMGVTVEATGEVVHASKSGDSLIIRCATALKLVLASLPYRRHRLTSGWDGI